MCCYYQLQTFNDKKTKKPNKYGGFERLNAKCDHIIFVFCSPFLILFSQIILHEKIKTAFVV